MIFYVVTAVAGLLIGHALWSLHRAMDRRTTREFLNEFERHFPGRCPVCSFHRYGLREGFEKKAKPDPHWCPEAAKRAKWRSDFEDIRCEDGSIVRVKR